MMKLKAMRELCEQLSWNAVMQVEAGMESLLFGMKIMIVWRQEPGHEVWKGLLVEQVVHIVMKKTRKQILTEDQGHVVIVW